MMNKGHKNDRGKFIRNIFIAGVIGIMVGISYWAIISLFRLPELLRIIFVFSIGLPAALIALVMPYFGYTTFGDIVYAQFFSIVAYFFLGMLVYYTYYKIKKLRK